MFAAIAKLRSRSPHHSSTSNGSNGPSTTTTATNSPSLAPAASGADETISPSLQQLSKSPSNRSFPSNPLTFPQPTLAIEDPCSVSIETLLGAYKECIDLLKASLEAEIAAHKRIEKADPNFGDDIYLLRFVLSNYGKGFDACRKAVIETIKWRGENADMLHQVRSNDLRSAPPNDDTFRRYIPCGPHYRTRVAGSLLTSASCSPSSISPRSTAPITASQSSNAEALATSSDGHFLFIYRSGVGNADLALKHVGSKNAVADWLLFLKEWQHGICDGETRRLGRLIKMIALMDFKYVKMSDYKGTFKDAMDDATEEAKLYYPQLLYKTIFFNVPWAVRRAMSAAIRLFSAKTRGKMVICPSNLKEGEGHSGKGTGEIEGEVPAEEYHPQARSSHPPATLDAFAREHLGLTAADLPSFLGGHCNRCENGVCIRGHLNDQPHRLTEDEARQLVIPPWDEFTERAKA